MVCFFVKTAGVTRLFYNCQTIAYWFIPILIILIFLTYFLSYPVGPIGLFRYIWRTHGKGPGITGLLIVLLFQVFLSPLFPILAPGSPLLITGLPLVLIGFTVFFLGKVHLGSSWGVPAQHNIHVQKHLITSGIYQFTRNPIYVGLLTFFVGSETILNSWLLLLVVPVAFGVHARVLTEEKLLFKHFPKSFPAYFSSVPRYF